jgi:hypothetical protein
MTAGTLPGGLEPRRRAGDPAPPPLEIPEGFTNEWTDVFRSDSLIHFCLMTSIVAGAFQGWLKDRLPGAIPYALSDGAFILAVFLWLATSAVYRRPLLRAPGGTNMDLLLLAVILAPALYMLAPGTPFLIKLAGLRAWSAFPVACLIGMSIVRTPGQVRAYVGVILAVCAVTGVYGIMQYIRGPEAALDTALGGLRHGSTVFYDIQGSGTTDFRAFSTFTFPAPFAAMMVFGMLLAAGIVFSRDRPRRQRLIAALALPLLFVAMTVSGTRAALITLLFGLVVLGWLRGFSFVQLLVIPALLIGLHIATLLTSGRIVERYRSLALSEGVLWLYVTNPISTALTALAENPFGLGLGRTGVGVPFPISSRMPYGYFIFSDGDIGRGAVELGVIGLVVLGFIIIGLLPRLGAAAKTFARREESDLALGIGALVLSSGIVILIGSPLSTTPHAIIWWFMFGALVRLIMMRLAPAAGPDPDDVAPPPPR